MASEHQAICARIVNVAGGDSFFRTTTFCQETQMGWNWQSMTENVQKKLRNCFHLRSLILNFSEKFCNKLCCACCVHQKSENLNFWSKRKVVFVFAAVLDVQTRNCCKLASFPTEDEKRSQSSVRRYAHDKQFKESIYILVMKPAFCIQNAANFKDLSLSQF